MYKCTRFQNYYVATVEIIISLDGNGTLDFRFEMLTVAV